MCISCDIYSPLIAVKYAGRLEKRPVDHDGILFVIHAQS